MEFFLVLSLTKFHKILIVIEPNKMTNMVLFLKGGEEEVRAE